MLSLGSTSLLWSVEIWCAISTITSCPSGPPKAFPVRVLSQIDQHYRTAWSYHSEKPSFAVIVRELRRSTDFDRGFTIAAFLDIEIEHYGVTVGCKILKRLYENGLGTLSLHHLPPQRLRNVFVSLLKRLLYDGSWEDFSALSEALGFGERIIALADRNQGLFCATMECLRPVEMPLCFWLFNRLTQDRDD